MSVGLPQGWASSQLGDVADLVSGAGFPEAQQCQQGHQYPFFKVGNLKDVSAGEALTKSPHTVTKEVAESLGAKIIPEGAVVFAKIGMAIALNRRRLIGRPSCIDNNMMAAVGTSAVVPRLLLRLLETMDFMPLSQSTTVPSLRKSDLQQIAVPLPPLAEQRRIVAKLDVLLGKVDACQKRLANITGILKRFRQSVLAAACSGRLTADWREEHPGAEPAEALLRRISGAPALSTPEDGSPQGDTDLPEGWAWSDVGGVVQAQNGRPFPSQQYTDDGVPLLRPGNLHVSGRVVWTAENTAHLPPVWARDNPEFLLRDDELVMNLTAQSLKDEFLGRVCMKRDAAPALLNQRICRFKNLGQDDLRPYLFLYFKSPRFRAYVDTLDTGSLIRHMHSKQVLAHAAPIPPLAEQQEIVRRVSALFALADQIEARYAKAKAHVDRLTQSILAKAFRGELVPQDPNDEPVSVLLERVRTQREGVGGSSKQVLGKRGGRRKN